MVLAFGKNWGHKFIYHITESLGDPCLSETVNDTRGPGHPALTVMGLEIVGVCVGLGEWPHVTSMKLVL